MDSTKWGNGIAEWVEGDTAFVSVVFSWMLQKAYARCVWFRQAGYKVRAGGPAVTMNPDALTGVAELGGDVSALKHHNENGNLHHKRMYQEMCFLCRSKN